MEPYEVSLTSLQTIGLEPRDYAVFVELLKHPNLSVRRVAELTKLNRGVAYNSIKKLQEMGLVVTRTTGKQLRYSANNPSVLEDLMVSKRRELSQAEAEMLLAAQSLSHLQNTELQKAHISVFEGYEGINTALHDILNTMRKLPERQIYVYASERIRNSLYKFFEDYTRKRVQYGIKGLVIASGSGVNSPFSDRKYLSGDFVDPSSYTVIYHDKFAILSIAPDTEPYAIIMRDPGVVAMHLAAFKTLWESLPPAQVIP